MVSLSSVNDRFMTRFQVVEGGRGFIEGIISETEQNAQPSYIFVKPRHVLRTRVPTALRFGMVLRSASGALFIVGDNGPSEVRDGTLWQSYRLFEPTGQYRWERRVQVLDPITKQKKDTGQLQLIGMIYAAIEPMDREMFDRQIRSNFEQSRFVTGAAVKSDDLIDNRAITKVDKALGIWVGVIS